MNNFPTWESQPSVNSGCYESEIRFFHTADVTFELSKNVRMKMEWSIGKHSVS